MTQSIRLGRTGFNLLKLNREVEAEFGGEHYLRIAPVEGTQNFDLSIGDVDVATFARFQSLVSTHIPSAEPIPTRQESASVLPTVGTSFDIGSGEARFGIIYCESVNILSDRNAKSSIAAISSELASALVNTLQPVSFRYEDFNTGMYGTKPHSRTHFGFIAQDVADALVVNGMTPANYGVYCEDDVAPNATVAPAVIADGKIRSLRTEQIIPLLVGAVQHLSARVAALEASANPPA